jgi:hypothetical protein
MKKSKNKKLEFKLQALKNQIKKDITEKKSNNTNLEINFDLIKKDLYKTILMIAISFGLLFLIKYLDSNFFLNKFF